MASEQYVCALFTIVLNKTHNYKNILAIGRLHREGYETFSVNREKYIKSVITDFDNYDDIDHIIPLSTIPYSQYQQLIEFYFTKNMRYFMIDVACSKMAFTKPAGWYEKTA